MLLPDRQYGTVEDDTLDYYENEIASAAWLRSTMNPSLEEHSFPGQQQEILLMALRSTSSTLTW